MNCFRKGSDRERLTQVVDDGGENGEGLVDIRVGGHAAEGEPDSAVGDAVVDVHGAEDWAGFEAAAGAGGAGAGADVLLGEEEEDGFGFEVGEGDVGGVGEAVGRTADDVGVGDGFENGAFEAVAACGDLGRDFEIGESHGRAIGGFAHADEPRGRFRCRRGGRVPAGHRVARAASGCRGG